MRLLPTGRILEIYCDRNEKANFIKIVAKVRESRVHIFSKQEGVPSPNFRSRPRRH